MSAPADGTDRWRDRRVLLVHPGALGDLLTAVPAIAALRGSRPAAIVLAARGAAARLLRSAEIVDEVWDLDAAWAAPWFAGRPADPPGSVDVAVRMTRPDRDLDLGLRTAADRVTAVDPGVGSGPMTDRWARPFGDVDSRRAWLRAWALRLPDPAVAAAGPAVIHPGSGSRAKNWPPHRWREVADRVGAGPVVILEGPADGDAVADALAGWTSGGGAGPTVFRNRSLSEVAALFARCRRFIGNDSGVAHLAGLVGAPSVVLFGPSDPCTWRPAGPRVRIVARPGGPGPIADLPVAAVADAVSSPFAGD